MAGPARHDVAVVGAGPAGCATAIELRRRGVERVVVLDGGPRRFPVGETLPPHTRDLLDRLGAWDDFVAAGHERCPGSCSAWGGDELGYDDFIVHPHGHGWHLDRARFDADLARRAAAAGATVLPGRVHAVDRRPDGRFRLDQERAPVEAEVVVDATGAAASVARRLGAQRRVHDRLTCVAGLLRLPAGSPMPSTTILEAVPAGWWYAARVPGERALALVATESAVVRDAALDDETAWRAALDLTQHIGAALAGARLVPGGLTMRVAPSAVTEPSAGDGWLAVGDAAAAFDPLSSQGIHQALADGLSAADAVADRRTGDRTGFARHDDLVRRRFGEYVRIRDDLYAVEERWPHEPFWAARRVARTRLPTRSA